MHHRVILSSLFSSLLGVYSRSVSNTQAIHNIGSWVNDHTSVIPVVPMSQDGSARSDPLSGGQEELGGVSHSESMTTDMLKVLANLTMQNQQLLQQQLPKQQLQQAVASYSSKSRQWQATAGYSSSWRLEQAAV